MITETALDMGCKHGEAGHSKAKANRQAARKKLRAQVRQLVEGGYSNGVIADKTGVGYSTVTRWIRECGWRPKPKLSPRAEKRLRLMAKQGWACGTIGAAMGLDRKTLKKRAADMGIEFATGTRPRRLAEHLKLDPMKRWEAEIKRRAEKEIAENPLDEWAWA